MSDNAPVKKFAAGAALLIALATGLIYGPRGITPKHEGSGPEATTAQVELAAANSVELALALIKNNTSPKYAAYPDPGYGWRVPTICYGTTIYPDGRRVQRGDVATREQCEAYLHDYYVRIVVPAIDRLVKIPLTPAQAAGAGDFLYNVGEPQFAASTLLRLANAGECEAAAREFGRWKYSNGKLLPGLPKRRADEAALWRSGC